MRESTRLFAGDADDGLLYKNKRLKEVSDESTAQGPRTAGKPNYRFFLRLRRRADSLTVTALSASSSVVIWSEKKPSLQQLHIVRPVTQSVWRGRYKIAWIVYRTSGVRVGFAKLLNYQKQSSPHQVRTEINVDNEKELSYNFKASVQETSEWHGRVVFSLHARYRSCHLSVRKLTIRCMLSVVLFQRAPWRTELSSRKLEA